MNRLTLLPDELYKHVYSFIYQPKHIINKYTNKHNMKCQVCNEIPDNLDLLFHICTLCPPYIAYTKDKNAVCDNSKICIFCMSA
jgi:hypothetical protein